MVEQYFPLSGGGAAAGFASGFGMGQEQKKLELMRQQMDAETFAKGQTQAAKAYEGFFKELEKLRDNGDVERLTKLGQSPAFQMSLQKIGQLMQVYKLGVDPMQSFQTLLTTAESNSPEEAGARQSAKDKAEAPGAAVKAGAIAEAQEAAKSPGVHVVQTDEGATIVFADPKTGEVSKSVPVGSAPDLSKMRGALAMRGLGKTTGNKQIDALTPAESNTVLQKLNDSSIVNQILGSVLGGNAAATASSSPPPQVLPEPGFQRAMQLYVQGALTPQEAKEFETLWKQATPEQRNKIKAMKKPTTPQVPVQ